MASKIQRRVNKTTRPFRRLLREDPYLQNRFYLNQIQSHRQDDTWYFRFEIYDKKTNDRKQTHWFTEYNFIFKHMPRDLFHFCNNYIGLKLSEENDKG